jgi:hypothetical protein
MKRKTRAAMTTTPKIVLTIRPVNNRPMGTRILLTSRARRLIGSTPAGRTLVAAFNAFYYSWSPTIAQTVAGNELLRALFRVLLLPIIGIVHVTAFMFTSVTGITESADVASIVAFLIAASFSVLVYIALPVLVATRLEQAIRRR